MPSPIGHALAGVATAWTAQSLTRGAANEVITPGRLTLVCALLAAVPDIDLLYSPIHRTATHSLVSAAVVFSISAAVTGWVTPPSGSAHGRPVARGAMLVGVV